MYNTGCGVEIGFDSINASDIDFHSYDSGNIDYDTSILCEGTSRTTSSGGGGINIIALSFN